MSCIRHRQGLLPSLPTGRWLFSFGQSSPGSPVPTHFSGSAGSTTESVGKTLNQCNGQGMTRGMINYSTPGCLILVMEGQMRLVVLVVPVVSLALACAVPHGRNDTTQDVAPIDVPDTQDTWMPETAEDGSVSDISAPEVVSIDINPESILPGTSCLEVTPADVHFGGVAVATAKNIPIKIKACNEHPLRIDGIYLADESSTVYSLDLPSLSAPPSKEHPIIMLPGDEMEVIVKFFGEIHSDIDDDGNHVLEDGTLVIDSTAVPKLTHIPLSGAAVDFDCPTAVIKCEEGDSVLPQTLLHLSGDESYSPNGSITKWKWEVEQPQGAQGVFVPAGSFPNPTFEVGHSGEYRFKLTVYDSHNVPSCYPAVYEVKVGSPPAIHVELTWTVPGSPDEIPPREADDLDLHFAHPWAAGPDLDGDGKPDGWYDVPFDCNSFNENPNWGSYDPGVDDDPVLDAFPGSETVTLKIPENASYRVGVHYLQSEGEPAEALVRVFIYGDLAYETHVVTLNPLDMWEVLSIEWPTGIIQVAEGKEGGWKITPDYTYPYYW